MDNRVNSSVILIYNKSMYLHHNPIKYVEGNVCSKCNKPVERSSKSKVIKFVCGECKQKRNRERTNLAYKSRLKTILEGK